MIRDPFDPADDPMVDDGGNIVMCRACVSGGNVAVTIVDGDPCCRECVEVADTVRPTELAGKSTGW